MYTSYGEDLAKIKSLSDELVFHPVKYRVLFGNKAESTLQAKFKIVKNAGLVLNDNDIKSRVISLINQFFALENWEFGDKFYFSELSTYVMKEMAPDIVTFLIVPQDATQTFGSLFEIKSESDEIFISGATVNDLEIIDAITANQLVASGKVVTSGSSTNTGITSAAATSTGATYTSTSSSTISSASTTSSSSTSSSSPSSSGGGGYSSGGGGSSSGGGGSSSGGGSSGGGGYGY